MITVLLMNSFWILIVEFAQGARHSTDGFDSGAISFDTQEVAGSQVLDGEPLIGDRTYKTLVGNGFLLCPPLAEITSKDKCANISLKFGKLKEMVERNPIFLHLIQTLYM